MLHREQSSFRDPSGYIFVKDNVLLRQINESYRYNYDMLIDSGLYSELVNDNKLISHTEIVGNVGYKTIKPEVIEYISYPYEWCFDQYKDAAVLTLEIAKKALEYNMVLKDASAYNIQFRGCKPIFIDTLSFEKYEEGRPWVAYGQFCRHFLAPLALMAYKDIRLSSLMRNYIDGIPLDLASKLLPRSTHFNLGMKLHLHLHAKQQDKYSDSEKIEIKEVHVPKANIIAIIDNLIKIITKLKVANLKTEWSDYYKEMLNYSQDAFSKKHEVVKKMLEKCEANVVCDMGANQGEFSLLAQKNDNYVIAYDIDPIAVNNHYNLLKVNDNHNILPLIVDLTNPSPSIGWANEERKSIDQRSNWDCTMALALIHHLAISNNLPQEMIAQYFSKLSTYLIIEFVPKEDSQVQKLLKTREDIFTTYTIEGFEESFNKYYEIIEKVHIDGSSRVMYLMKRKI